MTKTEIKNNLQDFSNNNFLQNSLDLFLTLGYTTKRQYAISSLEEFKNRFLTNSFNEDKLMFSEWNNAQFLFELQANDLNSEETTITTEIVDNKAIETYWFFAIELKGESYTKKQLSEITREINKQRPIPAFILFKYADKLTFSIIDRRLNKKDDNKDVLEKVVLIKDINYTNPHRAHIDILSDISFENIKDKFNVSNFVELHLNWLKALSVSELNKRFYTELSNWFFWTMDTCQLSKDNTVKDNVMFGIRMVTRIIFDWFIKEKGLVSEKIFDKQTYLDLLKPEYKEQGNLYYKVVLQNLFFGCLSKPMDRREFRSETSFQGKNTGYDVNNLFRYAKYLNNPQDVVNLFKDIPFLNGGLFECTDDKRAGKYIDCFTDNESRNFLKISDDIFFLEDEKIVDLSAHFDSNKSYKNAKVKGLFPILNSYKFTIDETTPVEEEIALDPELLGRVFENLLAAHNPETKTTARKSTGSYYTPREIVDYMCEQSLISYLKTKVESLNIENIDDKLTELLSYSEEHSFNENEVNELIKAVNEVKILDPACGSGAFPMGLLHKLVHVLSKLDPHNKKWKDSQIEKANQIDDLEAREEAINIIEKQFNDNEMDYSRKLYLIQNCIFGVDIQPMATQISRLRFFISLIVDEKPNKSKPNMGILALPNLETKFVAANTLIDLPQNNLFSTFPQIVKLREELEKIRAMHFRANSSRKKKEIQNKDDEIRLRIKQESISVGATFESAAKLADWSPYDKDHSSDWFNPKWMFNVDKFDIVIGNPPYIKESTDKSVFSGLKNSKYYQGKMDLWYFFGCIGIDLLKEGGIETYIATNNWVTNDGASILRNKILKDSTIINFIDFGDYKIFETASIQTMVYVIKKTTNNSKYKIKYSKLLGDKEEDLKNLLNNNSIIETDKYIRKIAYINPIELENKYITFETKEQNDFFNKLKSNKQYLFKNEIYSGIDVLQDFLNEKNAIKLGQNFHVGDGIFVINKFELDSLNLSQGEYDFIKPYYTTKEICRYNVSPHNNYWIIYTDSSFKDTRKINDYPNLKRHLDKFASIMTSVNKPYGLHRSREQFIFENEKILVVRKCNKPCFSYVGFDSFVSRAYIIIKTNRFNNKYLTGLLNSKLVAYWLKNKGKIQGDNYQVDKEPILGIPIYVPNSNEDINIAKIVDSITNIINSDDYADNIQKQETVKEYENQIDIMVYKLYDLTDDEIKIVEGKK